MYRFSYSKMKKMVCMMALPLTIFGMANASPILIDNFDNGTHHVIDNNGLTDSNFYSGTGVVGGARQTRVRDAQSGVTGGSVHTEVNGQLLNYGNGAPEWGVHYGSAINDPFKFTPNPNMGAGSDLNLAMGTSSTLDFDVVANPTSFNVTFYTGIGHVSYSDSINLGLNSFSLSAMGLSGAHAADIDGIRFTFYGAGALQANAVTVDNLQFSATAVPEPSTYAMLVLGLVGLGMYHKRRKK